MKTLLQFHKYAPDTMHIEVSQGVPGDPHFLDVDKKHIEWNSAIGTHLEDTQKRISGLSIQRGG